LSTKARIFHCALAAGLANIGGNSLVPLKFIIEASRFKRIYH
jgi:hypothetical protein